MDAARPGSVGQLHPDTGGLTIDDYVAFPYGRDVVEGAHTQEATTDQLYNYGI